MGLWNRIYRPWTNSPEEELRMMLEEFAVDYYYDDFLQDQLKIVGDAVDRLDWYAVEAQAQALYGYIRDYDLELFLRVLEEVKYTYDI